MNARSYLVVPADRPERFDKACASGADVVILDLEDAVAPDAKIAARDAVVRWLKTGHSVALRINNSASEWFRDDLAVCRHPGICAVVVPKAEEASELQEIAAAAPEAALLPLIETARGFDAMPEIAKAKGVERLLFGTIDFRLDLGITGDDEELLYFRSQMVLVSRLANLAAPVDGVCTSLADDHRLRTDTLRAKRIGFGGKLCIHPKQISTVNAFLQASQEELVWAHRVIEASAQARGAAVAVDGKMVDLPLLLLARRTLTWGMNSAHPSSHLPKPGNRNMKS